METILDTTIASVPVLSFVFGLVYLYIKGA
jgi:hypothetical protein